MSSLLVYVRQANLKVILELTGSQCSSKRRAVTGAVFWLTGHFSTPPENWTVWAFLQLSNDFTAAWLTFTFPQLFAVAATLKSIDYNVAMTFILNNNNNNSRERWGKITLTKMCSRWLLTNSLIKSRILRVWRKCGFLSSGSPCFSQTFSPGCQ